MLQFDESLENNRLFHIILLLIALAILMATLLRQEKKVELISPVWSMEVQENRKPVTRKVAVEKKRTVLKGYGSYYTVEGCLGCREDRKMANGEVLDDTKYTVALNRVKKNSMVRITNLRNGKVVTAKVTDRGGFERHGRIIDVSLAVKNAIDLRTDQDLLEIEVL